jgi:UDP-N-acetylmuramoyl-tripeptide--D-alanyl-D-alanine ligase
VIAAGEFVAALDGTGWMVLGEMGELGEDAQELHKQVGTALREAGIARVFAVGELSKATVDAFGEGGEWFASMDELTTAVASDLNSQVNVLVKGSRSARMERAVEVLRAAESMRREA